MSKPIVLFLFKFLFSQNDLKDVSFGVDFLLSPLFPTLHHHTLIIHHFYPIVNLQKLPPNYLMSVKIKTKSHTC